MAPLPLVTGSNTGRVVALLVCAALWLGAWAFGLLPSLDPRTRPLTAALATVAGVVVVASALSPYAERALTWGSIGFFGAPVWLALLVIVWGALRVSLSGEGRFWMAAALGWLTVSLVWGSVDALSGRPVTGGFNTGNHFAVMLVASVPVVLWGASVARSRVEAVAWCAFAAAGVIGVVAAGSAAGLVGLAADAVLLVIVAPALVGAGGPRAVRWVRAGVGGVVVVALLVALVGWVAPGVLPGPVGRYVDDDIFGPTADTRIEMWKAAAQVVAEHPLLGVGADGYHLAAQPYLGERLFALEPVTGILSAPPDPHSWVVLAAVSFGVLGLLAIALLGVALVRDAAIRREAEAGDARALRAAAGVGAAGFLTAMLFVPWAAILGGFPVLCLGLAAAWPRRIDVSATAADVGDRVTRGESDAGGSPTVVPRVAAALGSAGFVVIAVMLLGGVIQLDRAQGSATAESAAAGYEAAATWLPTHPYPRFMALHVEGQRLGGQADRLADWQARVITDRQLHEDATYSIMFVRDSLDQAYRWGRSDLAWETALLGDALRRFPAAPDGRVEQAHLAVLAGDPVEAARLLDAIDERLTADSRVSLYRYYIAVAEGDPARALALRGELEAEYGPLALLDPQ